MAEEAVETGHKQDVHRALGDGRAGATISVQIPRDQGLNLVHGHYQTP